MELRGKAGTETPAIPEPLISNKHTALPVHRDGNAELRVHVRAHGVRKWRHKCVSGDMNLCSTAPLMGSYWIRDTYTTQAHDNANADLSSWRFYSKMACFLGKLNGALADGRAF